MVSPSGVLLTARRGVSHVQISPIAYVLQSLAIEIYTGSSGLVAFAHVPLVANVARGKLSLLLLLAALVALCAGARRLSLRVRGLAFQVGSGPNEVIPESSQLSCGEEALSIPPVVGVLAQHKIYNVCARLGP